MQDVQFSCFLTTRTWWALLAPGGLLKSRWSLMGPAPSHVAEVVPLEGEGTSPVSATRQSQLNTRPMKEGFLADSEASLFLVRARVVDHWTGLILGNRCLL